MSLPASVTPITLTGTFTKPDGTADSGRVVVKSKWFVQNSTDNVVLSPYFVTTELNTNGSFSLVLPANNDTGWSPTGWSYEVTLHLSAGTDIRGISLDKDAAGGTVDITDFPSGQALTTQPGFFIPLAEKGAVNGVAPLDVTSQIPAEYLGNAAAGSVPDATPSVKGKLQLAGDLGGTASSPTVPGLAAKADDTAVVHKTGAETVAGVKTFSSEPVVPTPTANASPATKLYVDNGLAAKATDNAVVHLTGAETVAGVKTFSSLPVVPLTPTANGETSSKKYVDDGLALKADDTAVVKLTGAQTVAGVKTFSSLPIIPLTPTANGEAASKKYVDDADALKANDSAVVKLTGAQTVAGVKTFSSSPVVPTPSSGTDAANKSYVDGRVAVLFTISQGGALTATAGVARLYNDSGRTLTITAVRTHVGTAPTGATLIVDVNKNGTTIFTTQGNRPTVAISGNTSGKVTNMDVTSLADGDYLTVDIDQIGSTVAGSDLTVTIWAA